MFAGIGLRAELQATRIAVLRIELAQLGAVGPAAAGQYPWTLRHDWELMADRTRSVWRHRCELALSQTSLWTLDVETFPAGTRPTPAVHDFGSLTVDQMDFNAP